MSDWDEDYNTTWEPPKAAVKQHYTDNDDFVDEGRTFGAGRGYTPFTDESNGGGKNGRGRQDRSDGSSYRPRRNDGDDDHRGGGRGGDRGPRGGGGDEQTDNVERPKVTYVPKDIDDNDDLFDGGISSGINFDNYENIVVEVTGENSPPPIRTFEGAKLHPVILENIRKCNYSKPTPVQKRAIPIIMEGRDMMACAQTGSGKTAAFLLPIIHNLMADAREAVVTPDGCARPQVVIVSPTRELTIQIYKEAIKFSQNSKYNERLKCCIAYGGVAPIHQGNHIRKGCHILVATPGRLADFVRRNTVDFGEIRFVVLDEADRMLDMGFMTEVEKMMEHPTMPGAGERVTLMFSATFPVDIQKLAAKFLFNYLFIAVGIVGGACSDVEQAFYQVSKFEKKKKLKEMLSEEGSKGVLVFVETKRNADFIAIFLSEQGFPTTSIHGDRLQREREEALDDFKSGKCGILVATAVAARGLDIKNVSHVVNYDLPQSIDEYVHRIGRTGRVGNRGKATSFYDEDHDSKLISELVTILKQAGQPVPDFLSANAGYAPCGPQETFGGEDIRTFNNDNEEWD